MKRAIAIFLIMAFVAAFADNPHVTQLIELLDVAISSPHDGDVLTFDAAAGKWINKPAARPQRIDFNGLAGSLSDTELFTANEAANYRVTITASTPAPVTVTVSSPNFFDIFTLSPDFRGVSAVFRANAVTW